jgi:putative transferase (TIGR04331 family)
MNNRELFLITTAEELTWRVEKPVLFLGNWSTLYSREDYWKKLDYTIAGWHWDDQGKYLADYQYLNQLFETLLAKLADKLNQIHGLNENIKYWRIMVGPWLGYFLHIIFDRWEAIKNADANYTICGTCILDLDEGAVVANDMKEFVKLSETDFWNHYIYAQIIKNYTEIKYEIVAAEEVVSRDYQADSISNSGSFKSTVRGVLGRLSSFFVRPDDAFIFNTTLPIKKEIELHLKFKQFPQIWNSVPVPQVPMNDKSRGPLLDIKNDNAFERFASELIFTQMPVIYLEGFSELKKLLTVLPWPRLPKFIFSSCILHDTVALAYVAETTRKNTHLIYGQHGGVYGMAKFSWAEDYEKSIADLYLTWGWEDKANQHVRPAGIFRTPEKLKYNARKKNILFVTLNSPRYNYRISSESLALFNNYFRNSFAFVKSLSDELQNKLLIRLTPTEYGWFQSKRWKDRYPTLRQDAGNSRMTDLMKESKLIVYTYNSTGYLESLAAGIPTIIFWDETSSSVREDAKPYLEVLRNAGIFHGSPESAARFIMENWENIDKWWDSEKVVHALDEFNMHYCRQPENLLNTITKEIKQLVITTKSESQGIQL